MPLRELGMPMLSRCCCVGAQSCVSQREMARMHCCWRLKKATRMSSSFWCVEVSTQTLGRLVLVSFRCLLLRTMVMQLHLKCFFGVERMLILLGAARISPLCSLQQAREVWSVCSFLLRVAQTFRLHKAATQRPWLSHFSLGIQKLQSFLRALAESFVLPQASSVKMLHGKSAVLLSKASLHCSRSGPFHPLQALMETLKLLQNASAQEVADL